MSEYKLYESPIVGAFNVNKAFEDGKTEDQIRLEMEDEDQDDIDKAILQGTGIRNLYSKGIDTESIRSHLVGQLPQIESVDDLSEMDPSQAMSMMGLEELPEGLVKSAHTSLLGARETAMRGSEFKSFIAPVTMDKAEEEIYSQLRGKVDAYETMVDPANDMTLSQYMANYKFVYPNLQSNFTRTAALFGNKESEKLASQAELAYREHFAKRMSEDFNLDFEWVGAPDPAQAGLTNQYGDIAPDPDIGVPGYDAGYWVMTNPDGTKSRVDEGMWDSLKAEEGAITGAVTGGLAASRLPIPHPLAKGAAIVVGGAVGAAAGSIYDTAKASMNMHEELAWTTYAHNAMNESQLSVFGELVGMGLFKTVGGAVKHTRGAWKKLLAGNKEGARIALREELKITDDAAEEMLNKLERVATVPGKTTDKDIASFVLTQPGGEEIMRVAGDIDPAAHRTVALDIDSRAKDLLKTSSELTDENFGKTMKQDLVNYTNDVSDFFEQTKQQAAQSPHVNAYSFNYHKLGVEPVLKLMASKIDDLAASERFVFKMNKIKERADGRSFADLLDLRKTINGFRFGRGLKKASEQKQFKELIIKIDEMIDEGADVVLENPEQWKKDWKKANSQYAQMKGLEKNMLAKALRKPGITEEQIVKNLSRYITSVDETWTDVVSKLPKAAQEKAEGAVLNHMTNKYTAGLEGGLRATNFPMLSEELAKISFTTKEARQMKGAIDKLAQVFLNDIPLAQQTGTITIPKNQSYLTTDPVARLKYEFANVMFRRVKEHMPTRKSRALALMMRTTKLLENPLDVKSARALMKEVGDNIDIADRVQELQKTAAARAPKDTNEYVQLYGTLGNKTFKFKGTGTKTRMHRTRIAGPDDITRLQQLNGIHKSDIKATNEALKRKGYRAKLLGSDRVEML